MSALVRLDTALCDQIRDAARAANGSPETLRHAVRQIVAHDRVFSTEKDAILHSLDQAFDFDALLSHGFWDRQDAILAHLRSALGRGLDDLARYLPRSAGDVPPVTVHAVPGFATNYGSADGEQVFAIHGDGDPEEAYLFLLHVCYHEISARYFSEASRLASASPDTPERFRHWLLLLIQNEGIANFAVLEPVLRLRELGRASRYFTYAPLIGQREATAQAMSFCRKILTDLDPSSVEFLRGQMNLVLKNPKLPVIPLVGIHLAVVIAKTHGVPHLVEVTNREPQEFFAAYAECRDDLSEFLFGPSGDAMREFGLDAQPVGGNE